MDHHTKLGQELIEALEEVKLHSKGDITLSCRTVNEAPDMNFLHIKNIRKKLNLTQNSFANNFGFSLGAVKDWEQGRRKPEKSARILLAIIDKEPQVVERILKIYQ